MIRAAGFVLAYTSRTSEAAYYEWPDCLGLLRIAAHAQNGLPRSISNNRPVAARLTFSGNMRPRTQNGFERMVALAIGNYMLRAHGKAVLDADPR